MCTKQLFQKYYVIIHGLIYNLIHTIMSFFPRVHGLICSQPGADVYTDIDGNEYSVVTIGTQLWLVENLKTTKYADGTDITNLTEAENTVYDDWYLPSKDQLSLMKTNLHDEGVGSFGGFTWSSSEIDADNVWGCSFTGAGLASSGKGGSAQIRACRTFTAAEGAYALRDEGEAGGLIFYIDGTTYHEAAPADDNSDPPWSNITDEAIGTTGTGVGDGQANTTAILNQIGHTDSAAKVCDDLEEGENVSGWVDDTTGAYCSYDNDEDNIAIYGLLYNYFAITHASELAYIAKNGVKESGWHVPTQEEYQDISNDYGGASVSGGKFKETGTTHWASPNTGATNESGLTMLPGGYRASNGSFTGQTTVGYHGTTDEYPIEPTAFYAPTASYDSAGFNRVAAAYKIWGVSVRLVKDI